MGYILAVLSPFSSALPVFLLVFFFVSFEDARVVYLPNSVCVIFQCYVSDEVLSSYYWNDNSSFPESKRRGEGGTSPHDLLLCSSSILTLILSAHGCWSPP